MRKLQNENIQWKLSHVNTGRMKVMYKYNTTVVQKKVNV